MDILRKIAGVFLVLFGFMMFFANAIASGDDLVTILVATVSFLLGIVLLFWRRLKKKS